ncbi:MAG: trypsin-like serine protease [Saprospiraceae bacterium]
MKIILFILLTVPWGVIRHGIDKSKSLALAAQPEFACVGMFTQDRRIKGSCVLIHPRMALTAAHTLDKTHDRSPLYVEFGSTEILIDSFSIHPLYRQNKDADLAILYLSSSKSDLQLPKLNRSKKEIGQIGTSVGFGNFSVANNPKDIVESGRLKSAGNNMIDSLAGRLLPNGLSPHVYADFDSPDGPDFNRSGSAVCLDMEYGLDGGDSGGGMFYKIKGNAVLAGINAIQNKHIADIIRTRSFYGSSSQWVRVSVFRKWIKQQIKQYEKFNRTI